MIARGIRLIGLSAIAAALMAVACAASASAALPEIGHCVKQTATKEGFKRIYHGKYTNRKCTKEAKSANGKFEWVAGPGKEVEYESPGSLEPVTLETVGGTTIACANSKVFGEITGEKAETAQIGLFECVDTETKETCQSLRLEETPPTAEAGTILSQPLVRELGIISKNGSKTPKVGWEYKAKTGSEIFLFECGKPVELKLPSPPELPEVPGGTLPEIPGAASPAAASPTSELPLSTPMVVAVEGSFIGRVKPVDRPVEETFDTYLAPGGVQSPEMFEGGAKATLSANILRIPGVGAPEQKTEQVGYAGTGEESTVEPYEIRALP